VQDRHVSDQDIIPYQGGQSIPAGFCGLDMHDRAVLEDRAFVGMGAIVMDECRIGSGGMLAAGAMLTPGKTVPPEQLWAGRPAKYMRALDTREQEAMQEQTWQYVENARRHRAHLQG
jgi:carbonic anhydrase/acetyltransferase-like protein (isoleucine patch superfamily)